MKFLGILVLLSLGAYGWLTWQPAADSIAAGIMFTDVITHDGVIYESEWAEESVEITGHLRRKDRHYDKNIPIVTYDMVITTGEFNDPEIVKIRHKGGGNYFWRSQKQPEGTLVIYHTVPLTKAIQVRLDRLQEGQSITLTGLLSKNSEIRSNRGAFIKLAHDNHKFILVESAL